MSFEITKYFISFLVFLIMTPWYRLVQTIPNRLQTVSFVQNVNISRNFSVGFCRKGLEEFFPPGVYDSDKFVEENPIVGRAWKASELRIRSNSDLHKFWYVLLKEQNTLLTMRQECKRLGIPVPGPTRLHKVRKTMNILKHVIGERDRAILELEKERRYKFDDVLENEEQEIEK